MLSDLPSKFIKILTISDKNTTEFVVENIEKKNHITRLYNLVIVVSLVMLFSFIIYGFIHHLIDERILMYQISGGILLGTFPLVILHEWIQSKIYRSFGARKIKFQMSFKRMSFIVRAVDHLVNRGQMQKLVFYPFITINILLLIATILFMKLGVLILMALLIHNLYCMRDFSLLSYMSQSSDFFTLDTDTEETVIYAASKKLS